MTEHVSTRTVSMYNESVPYAAYVYSLYLFTERLYMACARDGVKNLFFLSREGQILKVLFDCYLTLVNNNSIKTHYFFTSRISSFVASLKSVEVENFDTLLRSYKHLSLSKFMENCGFKAEQIIYIKENAELNFDFEKIITDISDSVELKTLKKNKCFVSIYNKIRTEQRKNFLLYLDSFHTDIQSEGFHIVDVGWKGTIQDNFYRILGDDIQIVGYYLGLNETTNYNELTAKKGILFSCTDCFSPFYDVFFYDNLFFERLLVADHGGVIGYIKNEEGNVSINLDSKSEDDKNKRLILETQESIIYNFKQIHQWNETYEAEEADRISAIARIHLSTVLNYEEREKKLQNEMLNNHSENFGILSFAKKMKTDKAELVKNFTKFDYRRRDIIFTVLMQLHFQCRNKSVLPKILKIFILFYYPIYTRKQMRLIRD